MYHVCHRALLRAHFGQALDVGVPIDGLAQERIHAVSLASLELKTGALMAMALSLGGVLGGADEARLAVLDDFGHRFGVALQMFDDIGNLKGPADKQYEDLKLRRPSWIWAVAADRYAPESFEAFKGAVAQLPDAAPIETWMAENRLKENARERACAYLAGAVSGLQCGLGDSDGGSDGKYARVREDARGKADTIV